jgi:hypothetical protein
LAVLCAGGAVVFGSGAVPQAVRKTVLARAIKAMRMGFAPVMIWINRNRIPVQMR